MSLNEETANVLHYGTIVGITILAAGLLLSSFDFAHYVLLAGTVILVFTPMAGVLVSTKCLIQEKDRAWTKIAVILIAVIAVGLVFSYFT